MKIINLLAATVLAVCQAASTEPKLIYNYEMVRHGARAPMIGPGLPGTPIG
jgi:hypothetical protein